MSMKSIFEAHHVGTPFIERNYKAVLGQMEGQARIIANPPASQRPVRKGERTFSEKTMVSFPSKAT
jgi:hypothetical protein